MHDNAGQSNTLSRVVGLIQLVRPKQWVKNGFVLAPLIFTGAFANAMSVRAALIGMLLFCVASSATYIVNDLCDIKRDRLHPKKSVTRPLASGRVSPRSAVSLLLVLYAVLILGWWVEPRVILVIVGYLLLNLAYTFFLKHQPVIDIFVIAIGFVLRVLAGAVGFVGQHPDRELGPDPGQVLSDGNCVEKALWP